MDIPVTLTYPWSILRASATPELLQKVLLADLRYVGISSLCGGFKDFFIFTPWKDDLF